MFFKLTSELKQINTTLRMIAEAHGLTLDALEGVLKREPGDGLAKIEGKLSSVMGEVEAILIKADALKAAAAASEARERGHMNRAEKALEAAQRDPAGEEVDPFEAAGRAYESLAAEGNDDTDNGVSALPLAMEHGGAGLANARALKHGRR